jgi:broad specificity phosphatase PhoE
VRAFHRILDEADGRTAAVVCHGGNIRAITLEVVGMGAEHAGERWRVGAVANCSITAFERRHGRVALVTFNETGHLD